jgi:hypothetical protein
MVVKLLSRRGPYDLLLESIEKEKNLQIRKHVDEVQLEYNRDNSFHTGLKNQLYSIKLAREKENLEDAFKVKKELDELKLQKWKDKEMEKLNKEQNVALKSLDDILNNNHKIFSE